MGDRAGRRRPPDARAGGGRPDVAAPGEPRATR